jgi:hypothetical protein
MRIFAQKYRSAPQAKSAGSTTHRRAYFARNNAVNSILDLQRTIGNQAVQRLMPANAEKITRQNPPGNKPKTVTATAKAAPVSADAALAARISAVSMKASARPSTMRIFYKGKTGEFAKIELDKPMAFEGKVTFKSGPAQGNLTFGFFQIGRPFETYEAAWTRPGTGHAKPDIKVDESRNMRKELPAQDHATVLWDDPNDKPQKVNIGSAAKTVTAKFDDKPSTPFQLIRPSGNVDYRLSGVVAHSHFFTGFGPVKGGQALLLATRYWTTRYCEEIPPTADLKENGTIKVPVSLSPERDCRSHSCDLGEPGARDAKGNAPGWGNSVDTAKTYAYLANTVARFAVTKGPGKYDKKCTQPG